MVNRHISLALVVGACLALGCASIPINERAQARSDVNVAAGEALAEFIEDDPSLQEAIDTSLGYVVGSGTAGLFGPIGRVDILGVLYDREQNTRTYLNVDELRLGLGFGSADLQLLALITDAEALDRVKKGRWISYFDAISVAGDALNRAEMPLEGITVYLRSKSGAAVGANIQLVRVSVNTDLTDVGVSNVGMPMFGGLDDSRQGEDSPRIWSHKLPFLGQKVIDRGFDLPLPYGVGLIYVDVHQDMGLSNLFVGINGRDKVETPFVTFRNAMSETEARQIKLDAWLLPFLNVYATFGTVEGTAPMDVVIDGNFMLAELGTDCSGLVQSPLCDRLEDQLFTLPVRANLDLTNYGFGAVLAGGWKGWFGAVPFNVTYAEREDSVTDGEAVTVTPRVGRIVNMGSFGNLAIFVGGNYLKTEYTIDGTFVVPGDTLSLDYRVDQVNLDKWNVLLGFNWDITRRFSWSAEYDGFTGSRDAFITSLNTRF